MIPIATTRITWLARSEPEPGEAPTFRHLAAHVRAVISSPSPSEQLAAGGGRGIVDAVLTCDPVPGASHTDQVLDMTTGERWEVIDVVGRHGLGVDHTSARLRRVEGVTP